MLKIQSILKNRQYATKLSKRALIHCMRVNACQHSIGTMFFTASSTRSFRTSTYSLSLNNTEAGGNIGGKETQPQLLRAFSKHLVLHSQSRKTALNSPCNAPYYLPKSTAFSVKLLTQVYLSLEQGSRNLILASPHPGASILASEVVHSVASDIGADVQSLDYQALLEGARELGLSEVSWGSDEQLSKSNCYSLPFH